MRTHLFQAILCAAALWLVGGCENDIATVNKITAQREANLESGKEVEVLYSNMGHVKARINAPVVKRHKNERDPYTEMTDGVKMVFFDDSGKVQSDLSADYGRIDERTNQMVARNNVQVTSVLGDKLNTDELVWNENTRKISSDKFVKIQTKEEILYGDGFESNEDLTHYKIKQIRGRVKLKDNPIPNDNPTP